MSFDGRKFNGYYARKKRQKQIKEEATEFYNILKDDLGEELIQKIFKD